MSKTKSKVYDTADTFRPYVERAMADEKLRADVISAFKTAKKLYGELAGGDTKPVIIATRVATDEDVRGQLSSAIDDLKSASDRLKGKKDHSGRNTTLLACGDHARDPLQPGHGPGDPPLHQGHDERRAKRDLTPGGRHARRCLRSRSICFQAAGVDDVVLREPRAPRLADAELDVVERRARWCASESITSFSPPRAPRARGRRTGRAGPAASRSRGTCPVSSAFSITRSTSTSAGVRLPILRFVGWPMQSTYGFSIAASTRSVGSLSKPSCAPTRRPSRARRGSSSATSSSPFDADVDLDALQDRERHAARSSASIASAAARAARRAAAASGRRPRSTRSPSRPRGATIAVERVLARPTRSCACAGRRAGRASSTSFGSSPLPRRVELAAVLAQLAAGSTRSRGRRTPPPRSRTSAPRRSRPRRSRTRRPRGPRRTAASRSATLCVLRAGEVLEQVAVRLRRDDAQVVAQAVVGDDGRLRVALGRDLDDPREARRTRRAARARRSRSRSGRRRVTVSRKRRAEPAIETRVGGRMRRDLGRDRAELRQRVPEQRAERLLRRPPASRARRGSAPRASRRRPRPCAAPAPRPRRAGRRRS